MGRITACGGFIRPLLLPIGVRGNASTGFSIRDLAAGSMCTPSFQHQYHEGL
jgi:hypothetical protein